MNSFIRPIEGNNTLWEIFFRFCDGRVICIREYSLPHTVHLLAVNPNITFDLDEAVLSDPLVDLLFVPCDLFIRHSEFIGCALYFEAAFPNCDYNSNSKMNWRENFLALLFIFADDRRTIDWFCDSSWILFTQELSPHTLYLAASGCPHFGSDSDISWGTVFQGFRFQAEIDENPSIFDTDCRRIKLRRNVLLLTRNVNEIYAGSQELSISTFVLCGPGCYTIKTGSIEISLGAHAANNMFLCMFYYRKTVYGGNSLLFTVSAGNLDVGGFHDSGQSCKVCGDRFLYHKKSKAARVLIPAAY